MMDQHMKSATFDNHRRLSTAGMVAVFLTLLLSAETCGGPPRTTPREIQTDLLIVGGTESGWAAAIQAARMGVRSITIVHDGSWLGGQFTEQGLACVDENKGVGKIGWGVDWHPMKRSFHRSGLFKELMDRIEAFNTAKYGSPMPGRPWHGPSTFRPAEAEAIFREMLQPFIESGQVQLITNRYPVKADVDRSGQQPRLTGLWFTPTTGDGAADLHIRAQMTIDASDWGEAVQVSGAAFECGPDPYSRYGEPSAPKDLSSFPPNEMNPITWTMIVVESEGETPIQRPRRFDDRNYPRVSPFSTATMRHEKWDRQVPLGSILHWPDAGQASPRQLSVYTVRRLVDGETSKTGRTIILLAYMNGQDYALERLPQHVVEALETNEAGASVKNIVTMTRPQRQIIFDDAKQHALGVLYHLQHFVHDHAQDKTHSFRRFHLSEEFGTPDHLPPKPYIRESLRLKAMYMMREQDGRNRDGKTKNKARERLAHVLYPDGILCWQFHYDFHRTGRAFLVEEGAKGPWIDYHKPNRHTKFVSDRSLFPLRSLIPESMDGLLGAQKNLGYSSIVSAAIRLHDQCIAIGQAAGATAAVSLHSNRSPREFPYDRSLLEQVRHGLCGGTEHAVPLLLWPYRDLAPDHPAFVAINRLAARRALPIDPREVDFRPDALAEADWRDQVVRLSSASKNISDTVEPPNKENLTRGEFCRQWWNVIQDLPDKAFERKQATDADADGIPDRDDPLLFTPNCPIRFEVAGPPPDSDGVPPTVSAKLPSFRNFNFHGTDSPSVDGFTSEHGLPFDPMRGFGWDRNISNHHRRRGVTEGPADTFLFTRSHAIWNCRVPDGRYRVTVCIGDASHPQPGQNVTIEGKPLFRDHHTPQGWFAEKSMEVDIDDGSLTLEIGRPGSKTNTCLNWLMIQQSEGS